MRIAWVLASLLLVAAVLGVPDACPLENGDDGPCNPEAEHYSETQQHQHQQAESETTQRPFQKRRSKLMDLPPTYLLALGLLGLILFNVYKANSRMQKRRREAKAKKLQKQQAVKKEREAALKLLSENERKVEAMTKMLASMHQNLNSQLRERKRAIDTMTTFAAEPQSRTNSMETTFS